MPDMQESGNRPCFEESKMDRIVGSRSRWRAEPCRIAMGMAARAAVVITAWTGLIGSRRAERGGGAQGRSVRLAAGQRRLVGPIGRAQRRQDGRPAGDVRTAQQLVRQWKQQPGRTSADRRGRSRRDIFPCPAARVRPRGFRHGRRSRSSTRPTARSGRSSAAA